MEPYRFDHDGDRYDVRFEKTPEGWIAHIRREADGQTRIVGFPAGPGFDPEDVRGSLIAGCEAVVAGAAVTVPTRH